MDWWQGVDAYCERTGPEFWAEPLNAVTNAAFLLAAVYGAWLARRTADPWLGGLAAVAAAVGVGSFLFHTFATRWAGLADVIPIALFIAFGFALVMVRRIGLPWWGALLATAAFMGVSPVVEGLLRPVMGSSAGYAPAFLAMLLVGSGLFAAGRDGAATLVSASLLFGLSLTMRMADEPFCPVVPSGTHFLWHVLNAVVLALVIRAAARRSPARR